MSNLNGVNAGRELHAHRIRVEGADGELIYETDPSFRLDGGMIFIADGEEDAVAHPVSRVIEITGIKRPPSGAYSM